MSLNWLTPSLVQMDAVGFFLIHSSIKSKDSCKGHLAWSSSQGNILYSYARQIKMIKKDLAYAWHMHDTEYERDA